MTGRVDPATGTVTGQIPDAPLPRCEFCKDDLPEGVRVPFHDGLYCCADEIACITRQARREAQKAAEPSGTETEPVS